MDPASGVVTLSQPPDGSRWEYNFQAGASDRHGHVALVPVTVYILGECTAAALCSLSSSVVVILPVSL